MKPSKTPKDDRKINVTQKNKKNKKGLRTGIKAGRINWDDVPSS